MPLACLSGGWKCVLLAYGNVSVTVLTYLGVSPTKLSRINYQESISGIALLVY